MYVNCECDLILVFLLAHSVNVAMCPFCWDKGVCHVFNVGIHVCLVSVHECRLRMGFIFSISFFLAHSVIVAMCLFVWLKGVVHVFNVGFYVSFITWNVYKIRS